jgi:hypothetical protein
MGTSRATLFDQILDYLRQVLNGCIQEGLPKSTILASLGITLVFQVYLQKVAWPFAQLDAATGTVMPNLLFPIVLGIGATMLLVAIFKSGGGIMDSVLYLVCGYLLIGSPPIQWPGGMYHFISGAWLWSTVVLFLYAIIVRGAVIEKVDTRAHADRQRRRRFFEEAFLRTATTVPTTAETESLTASEE